MMDWNGHMSGGGWFFSILTVIIVVAIVGAVIVWIAREFSRESGPRASSDDASKDILDRRLASGEIDAEQYEQLRATLGERREPADAPPLAPATRA
jgi:putative membrane protein